MGMLKVRYMSDLHLEFEYAGRVPFEIPEHKDDKDTILIVAGDVGVARKLDTVKILYDQAHRFRAVLTCIGNHEAYGYSLPKTLPTLEECAMSYKNVFILENNFLIFDDVAFIGASLWSDFNNEDPICMSACEWGMNDYHKIRTGPSIEDGYMRILKPKDTLKIYNESVKYIFDAIKFNRAEGRKVVVFTHTGPSSKSTNPKYAGQLMNGAYTSNLDEQVLATAPDYWIHGHTHDSIEYTLGDTQVFVNPRGYVGYELNRNFDPNLYFEV